MNAKESNDSANVLRLLWRAEHDFPDRSKQLRSDLQAICHRFVSRSDSHVDTTSFSRFLNHCSNLGLATPEILGKCLSTIGQPTHCQYNHSWCAAGIAVWSAGLWSGLKGGKKFLPFVEGTLELAEPDWTLYRRLLWCVDNDPFFKNDPAIVDRCKSQIRSQLEKVAILNLADIVSTDSGSLNDIGFEVLLERRDEVRTVTRDTRMHAQLLRAWIKKRYVPEGEDIKFYKDIVSILVSSRAYPEIVLESLAMLNWPVAGGMRSSVFSEDNVRSLDKLCSLALSFSILNMTDVESTAYLATNLDHLLNESPKSSELWKIGLWYSTIVSGDSILVSSFKDKFRDLSCQIASGMWENNGAYVRSESKPSPADRAMRTVIASTVSSMGIDCLKNSHVVNTPIIAHLYLPSTNVILHFLDEHEDILSDGRCTGTVDLLVKCAKQNGIEMKLIRIAEWEKLYTSSSQDEFIDTLYTAIQPSN
jgi:hypothetical protein